MNKILILVLSISALFSCREEPKEEISKVDVATFKEALATNLDIQLIDVRTPNEYKEGHIENAMLIDYFSEKFKTKIQELDKMKPVYLYCKSGNRSEKSSKILADLGFTVIVDLKGGYMDWSKQME